MLIESNHSSCLGCVYLIKQDSCSWFDKPKKIPHDIKYKGCKHRIPRIKSLNSTLIVKRIVDLFKGELI